MKIPIGVYIYPPFLLEMCVVVDVIVRGENARACDAPCHKDDVRFGRFDMP